MACLATEEKGKIEGREVELGRKRKK